MKNRNQIISVALLVSYFTLCVNVPEIKQSDHKHQQTGGWNVERPPLVPADTDHALQTQVKHLRS